MTPIRCDAIAKVLSETLKSGWDDYVYLFSSVREGVAAPSTVWEATPQGTDFLSRVERLGLGYDWLQFGALKGDLPSTLVVEDALSEASGAVAELMLKTGWGSGLVWSVYSHDGARGYVALFRRQSVVPAVLAENTTETLLRWMPRFSVWARTALAAQEPTHAQLERDTLSHRETQCLLMVAEGKTSKEIARVLDISLRTVEFHIQNARKKLGGGPRSRAASRLVMLISRQRTSASSLARTQFPRVC